MTCSMALSVIDMHSDTWGTGECWVVMTVVDDLSHSALSQSLTETCRRSAQHETVIIPDKKFPKDQMMNNSLRPSDAYTR